MDEQLKQAFIQYLQLKSGAQTQEEFEAYLQQLGEEGLKQEYAQFMQLVQQQQVASRRLGGMLNYIQTLRGVCPEGYEMQYFKLGGKTCKKCMKKVTMEDEGTTPENPIDAFRCGRKMKKKKCENGNTIEMDKCGSKMKKNVRKKLIGGSMQNDVTPATHKDLTTLRRLGLRNVAKASDGNRTVGTVNWSDGTSTTINNDNNTVTGRDGRIYPYGTFLGDSIYNTDIYAPITYSRYSGKPIQINDRSREIAKNANLKWVPVNQRKNF